MCREDTEVEERERRVEGEKDTWTRENISQKGGLKERGRGEGEEEGGGLP